MPRLTEEEQADRAMTEVPTLTDAVVKLAKELRWTVKRDRQGKAGWDLGSGFPDLLLVRGGRLVFIELKRHGLNLDPKQEVWRDLLMEVVDRSEGNVEWYVFRPQDLRTGLIARVLA